MKRHSVLAVLPLLLFLLQPISAETFSFRVGAVLSDEGRCAGMEDAHRGYQLFADRIADTQPLSFKDRGGSEHRILFDYRRYDDGCEADTHGTLIRKLLDDDKVHFMFGSSPLFAEAESAAADSAGRLMYHCCVGSDALYEQDLAHVFGIQSSNSKYCLEHLKSLVLTGGVRRLYLFSLDDNIDTSSVCDAAAAYISSSIAQLNKGFQLVKHIKYNASQAAAQGLAFYEGLVADAQELEADAVLGCDLQEPGLHVTHEIADREVGLKSLWLTSAPAHPQFLERLPAKASEHVWTTAQWHPTLPAKDQLFGQAADYATTFASAFSSAPTDLAAGASGVSYSLALAIQQAFKHCQLSSSDTGLSTDQLLFDASVLQCVDSLGQPVAANNTGYALVLAALHSQEETLFFGRVQFNRYRQNIAKGPVVLQVQSGVTKVVLPLEHANTAIIIPESPSKADSESSDPRVGVLHKKAFIAVVVVIVGVALMCAVIVFLLMKIKRQFMDNDMRHQMVISPEDILIINPPLLRWDGTWESGKAMYRNSLVAVEPLWDLRLTDVAQTTSSSGQNLFSDQELAQSIAKSFTFGSRPSFKPGSPSNSPLWSPQMSRQGTLTHGMLGPVCEMTEDGSSLQSSVDGSGVPRTMRRQGSLGLVEAQDEDVSLPFPASSLQSKLAKQRDTYNTSPPYSPLRPSSPLPDSPRHPRRSNTTGHTPTTNSSNLQADQADTSPHAHAHLTLNDKSAAARSTSSDLQVKLPNPKEPFSSTEFTEDYRDSTSSSSKVRFSPFGFSLQGMGAGTAAKADSLYAQSLKSHASGRFREMASPISKDQVLELLWHCKSLQHPSICPIHGILWELPPSEDHLPPGMPFLVRELQELGTLSTVVEENEAVDLLDAGKELDIMNDMLQALLYLHAQDHPRLKLILQPKLSGVFLDTQCRAKIRVPLLALSNALEHPDQQSFFSKWSKFFTLPSQGSLERQPSRPAGQVHEEELEDVLSFGFGIACMLNGDFSSSQKSSRSSVDCGEEKILDVTHLQRSQHVFIANKHGDGLANLLCRCCSTDPAKRPSFAQIQTELEDCSVEMRVRAKKYGRNTPSFASIPSFASLSSMARTTASADELLTELFPEKVATALKAGKTPDPEPYPCVSLFFSDVVGYTNICSRLKSELVMDMLNRLYTEFDRIAQTLQLFKVETIGDAYMCVANLKTPQPDTHAAQIAKFAFKCCAAANEIPVCVGKPELGCIHIRVGIHSGPVMGAVVGTLNRRYCLFGDTVNVASRMESTSMMDHVQCSATFFANLKEQWPECADLAVSKGVRHIKGKGNMRTWFMFAPGQEERANKFKSGTQETGVGLHQQRVRRNSVQIGAIMRREQSL